MGLWNSRRDSRKTRSGVGPEDYRPHSGNPPTPDEKCLPAPGREEPLSSGTHPEGSVQDRVRPWYILDR